MYEFLINGKKTSLDDFFSLLKNHPRIKGYDDYVESINELTDTHSVEIFGDVFQINEVLV